MSATFEIEDGNGTLVMRKRFPSTALSRFAEKAPELAQEISEIFISKERVDEISEALDGDVDDEEDLKEKIGDEVARENAKSGASLAETGFELARVPVEEIEALHEFCATVTKTVKGYTDIDGEEPVAWSSLDKDGKLRFWDFQVSNMAKLSVYMHCWMLKNGMDPDELLEEMEEEEPDGGG